MYDYVIVGGGSAGCVLAARLSEDPGVRACMLEAGPPDDSFFVRMPLGIVALMRSRRRNWMFRTESEPNCAGRRMFRPRGRALDGSSAVNAMCRTRGHRTDYDYWAALGNDGWSCAGVLPYFKRFEHRERGADAFHGAGGPYNVAELRDPNALSLALVEAAAPQTAPCDERLAVCQRTTKFTSLEGTTMTFTTVFPSTLPTITSGGSLSVSMSSTWPLRT